MSNKRRGMLLAATAIAFLTVIFTGCVLDGQKALQTETVEPTKVTKVDSKIKSTDEKPNKEQKQILTELDALTAKKVQLHEAMSFVEGNMDGLSKNGAGELLLKLESYQTSELKKLRQDMAKIDQNKVFDANGVLITAGISTLPEGQLKVVLRNPAESGLKTYFAEGSYYLEIDYSLYQHLFSDKLDKMTSDYVKIRALESGRHYFEDGSLVVSWQELLDRLQSYEAFIVQYPEFKNDKVVKAMYYDYFKTFIYGGNNTPVFSYEDGKISDDVEIVYRNLKLDVKHPISGKYLKTYFTAVQKSKFRYSEGLNQLRNKLSADLKAELKLTEKDMADFYQSR